MQLHDDPRGALKYCLESLLVTFKYSALFLLLKTAGSTSYILSKKHRDRHICLIIFNSYQTKSGWKMFIYLLAVSMKRLHKRAWNCILMVISNLWKMFYIRHRSSNEVSVHFIIFVNMTILFNGSSMTPLFCFVFRNKHGN